jgi:hypothetical protein
LITKVEFGDDERVNHSFTLALRGFKEHGRETIQQISHDIYEVIDASYRAFIKDKAVNVRIASGCASLVTAVPDGRMINHGAGWRKMQAPTPAMVLNPAHDVAI